MVAIAWPVRLSWAKGSGVKGIAREGGKGKCFPVRVVKEEKRSGDLGVRPRLRKAGMGRGAFRFLAIRILAFEALYHPLFDAVADGFRANSPSGAEKPQ